MADLSSRIFVGVTCTAIYRKKGHWKEQLKEINRFGIKQIALFPTQLNKEERKELYLELGRSCVKEIKLVHLRGEDFDEKELEYFYTTFKTRWFNCHEEDLDLAYQKFPHFRKNILLEMNYNNQIDNRIEPNKLGGFCVDLSHFNSAWKKQRAESSYILEHLKNTKVQANHLNGYHQTKKRDLHFVTSLRQFDYLKDLPKELFSKVIALELENSIQQQLKFKEYILRLLKNKF